MCYWTANLSELQTKIFDKNIHYLEFQIKQDKIVKLWNMYWVYF